MAFWFGLIGRFCIFENSKLVVDTEADTGRPSIDRNILQNSPEDNLQDNEE